MEEPKSNDAKWYEIFKQKSWWQTLLSTKPVLAFSIVLVPIGIIAYFIYKKGQTDNEASKLQDAVYTPTTTVSKEKEAEFQAWSRTRLVNLAKDIFDWQKSYFNFWNENEPLLLELSGLDDRKLVTIMNYYSRKYNRSLRSDLQDHYIGNLMAPGSFNLRNTIISRIDALK